MSILCVRAAHQVAAGVSWERAFDTLLHRPEDSCQAFLRERLRPDQLERLERICERVQPHGRCKAATRAFADLLLPGTSKTVQAAVAWKLQCSMVGTRSPIDPGDRIWIKKLLQVVWIVRKTGKPPPRKSRAVVEGLSLKTLGLWMRKQHILLAQDNMWRNRRRVLEILGKDLLYYAPGVPNGSDKVKERLLHADS